MDEETALAHLPLLLIFYALQYWVLHQHLPDIAPWVALGSAGVLLAGYLVARQFLAEDTKAGSLLVGAYVAIVFFHAIYMESVSAAWQPWVALLMLPILALYLVLRGEGGSVVWPIKLLIGLIFAINYLRVLFSVNLNMVPAHDALSLIYAIQLYVGYYYSRQLMALKEFSSAPLYAGHIALMSSAVYLLDGRFAVSFTWGVIAISCLAISIYKQDKVLGTSSLLIFAISAAKVLLFDLAGAAPLVRIACLLVLGVTLYAGGWLYRKVDSMEQV